MQLFLLHSCVFMRALTSQQALTLHSWNILITVQLFLLYIFICVSVMLQIVQQGMTF